MRLALGTVQFGLDYGISNELSLHWFNRQSPEKPALPIGKPCPNLPPNKDTHFWPNRNPAILYL